MVTVLTVELLLFDSASLKDKRSVVRSVLQRARNKFGVAAAEVGDQDDRTRATLAFAAVSSDAQVSHASAQKVIEFLERERLDCQVGDVSTETLSL
ncbi:MAG: DUF503 domain-containing protein [Chloroflexi bacterium]|nr:DUF503 domain-containing protein [Chloroflexota bacterium]